MNKNDDFNSNLLLYDVMKMLKPGVRIMFRNGETGIFKGFEFCRWKEHSEECKKSKCNGRVVFYNDDNNGVLETQCIGICPDRENHYSLINIIKNIPCISYLTEEDFLL